MKPSKAESGKRKADFVRKPYSMRSAFRFQLSTLASFRFIALASLLAGITLTSGCRAWNPWGKGFDDEYSDLGAKARPRSTINPGVPSLGLSAKSRQIERNLGIE